MMLAHRIIPTLLCRGTALYKGTGFDAWRQVGHAMQAIRVYQSRGVDELILLNIEATPKGTGPDFQMVENLTQECFMPLTVGGGVKTVDDVKRLLDAGADKVSICSALFERHDLLRQVAYTFGSQAVVAAIDVLDGKVSSHCGKRTEGLDPVEWAKACVADGAGEILLTCVERDGQMTGYDLKLIESVCRAVTVPVIASGGAGTYEHLRKAIEAGASAVAVGAMFNFTDQTPRGAARYLAANGVEVRL